MTQERLFRRDGEFEALDWQERARELGVDLETARLLYEYAKHVALGEAQRAVPVYLSALRRVAADQQRVEPPVVGRMTRHMYEALPGKYRTPKELATTGAGRCSLVQIESTRRESQLPGYDDVQQAMAALMGSSLPASPAAAEVPVRATTEQVQERTAPAAVAMSRDQHQAVAGSNGSARAFDVAGSHGAPTLDEVAVATNTHPSVVHPVDTLRANARGLAADLTLAGVGIGRTAARWLRNAAAAPVGRRAAELADAWTGGAAREWTTRARGLAEGVARRAMAFHDRMAGPSASEQLERLPSSGGTPLPPELRARMEALFGHRLAHVRIHTDAAAAQAAEAAGARAVTMGSHVYFARGQFTPGTAAGDRLLVHELTHVVQHDRGQLAQPTGPGVELSSPSDPAEHEARAMEERASEVRAPEAPTTAPVDEVAPVHRAPVDNASARAHADVGAPDRLATDATGPLGDTPVTGRVASGNWITDKYHQAKDWAGEKLEDFENWAEDKAMGLIANVAPGLATLIHEGPGGLIKNAIEPAISGWVGSITGGVNVGQMAGQLKGTFTSAFAVLQGAKAGDPKCCDTLVSGINAIREVAQAFVHNPVFQAIKGVLEKVSGVVETITKLVAGPVFDVLKTIVGGAWDAIKSVASTIQKWFNAVKNVASKAFDWVAKKLGFSSGTGEGGLLDWLKQKAVEIWENIKKTLQPVLGPLKIVAGVLLFLTPLPEIYAIIKYGPQIVEAVQWLWANRNNPEAVKKNPGLLGGSILPKILGAGQSFVGIVKKGVAWLVEKTTTFATGALQLLGAITGVPLLSMARGFVQTIVDGVKGMQEWASGAFTSAVSWLEGTVHKVVDFIKPYSEVLCSVALAITQPTMIPVILAGWAWRWLPDCIKPPLIDLLLDAVIGFLSHMPSLPLLGPLWPLLKAGVMGFLQAVRARDPETKIKISNKLAKIISGSSPLFLLGFVKGLLKGVWDGIKMPFEAIWLILKGIGKAGDFFMALGTDADKEAQKSGKPAIPKATALPKQGAAHQPTGSTHTLPVVPGEIHPDEASAVVRRIAGQLNEQKQAQMATAPASASPSNPAAPVNPGTAPAANEYRALGQEARRMGGELAGPAHTVVSGFMPAVKELFSGGGKSMSINDLMAKLRKVWEAAKAAVAKIGAKIANMICDFLIKDSAEEELGEAVGYLVGMIAFQALLDAFSVGVWSEVNVVLTAIAKFLNWPMLFLGEAMKAMKVLGGYILDGLKSLGSMVAEAGAGALREVTGALREIAGKLGEFADELMAKFGKNAGKADGAAAHAAESDAAKGAESDAARTAEGEGAKKPGEGEGKPKNEGQSAAEKEAQKAEELAEAIAVSKTIATAEEAGHVPGPAIALSLDGLEPRYRWIKSYEAEPVAGGFDIFMIASKHHIKRVKNGGLTAPVDLEKYMPEGFTKVGDQISVDMSQDAWRAQIAGLPKKADYLYVVRNAETGEVLKVGSTSGIEGRLKDYRTANNTSIAHGGHVTVDIVQVKKPPGVTLETGEGGMRNNVREDATEDLTNPNEALPWDKSGGRGSGPGTPGNDSHNMKFDLTKWDGDEIIALPAAERDEFVKGVNAKYGAPPSDIAEQLAAKGNAEIARTQNVPTKVVRLWRNLVSRGLL